MRAIAIVVGALLGVAAGPTWSTAQEQDTPAAAIGAEAPADEAGPAPEEQAEAPAVPVEEWLVLGPVATPRPAFHDAAQAGYGVEQQAARWPLAAETLQPRARAGVAWPGAGLQSWSRSAAAAGTLALPDGGDAAEALAATYLTATRFREVTLALTSAHPLAAALDGAALELAPGEADGDGPAPRTASLALAPGKHLLVVRALRDPGLEEPWTLAAELRPGDAAEPWPVATLDPGRPISILDVVDGPAIEAVAVAPDGTRVAVTVAENRPDGTRERWVEVRRTADGGLIRSWRGGASMSGVRWAPEGLVLSYLTRDEGRATLWLHDLAGGGASPLLRDEEHLEDYRWAPDGTFLVVADLIEAEPDERQVKRVRDPADRLPWHRDRRELRQVSVPDGVSRPLTAGPDSPEAWSIAPDGSALLFTVTQPDWGQRPFTTQQLWRLELATLEATMVVEDRWLWSGSWTPDGARILVHASGSAFDGAGLAVPEGTTPNEFDGQLFLLDPVSGAVQPLTRELQPAVEWAAYSRADGVLYARVVDGQFSRLLRRDAKKERWLPVKVDIEVIRDVDLATDAPVAVAVGSGATTPPQLAVLDLKKKRSRVVLRPAAERLADVSFGRVEPWTATLPSGETLDGRVYLPPEFEAAQRYPAIVYYYGGTYPVTRDYGGRYPKNLWAAQGYVVYVVEPSGAIGYGQAFSARHVGEWGERTAGEVIAATEAFLAAHPYVDPARVGCIGASYGGFLTQDIVTRTDLFAAAVSHAGISTLSSYWGEGFWGYEYGAVAMADRYPWQDPQWFEDHSPLFRADRITTPLLLLHGTDDTNVPPGESDQLFTALRLLGREVEYVQVVGQDHHILDRDRRLVWNDTILAFFARQLQDDPAWWEHLYPDPAAAGE